MAEMSEYGRGRIEGLYEALEMELNRAILVPTEGYSLQIQILERIGQIRREPSLVALIESDADEVGGVPV